MSFTSTTVKDFLLQRSYLELSLGLLALRVVYVVLARLYQAYYEVWLDGGFVEHLEQLHTIYGPVIRVRPNELHFSSPEAYFAIYPSYSKFTKEPAFYKCFGEDESSQKAEEILNPLFSRRAILKLEGLVDLFIERLATEYTDKPANLFRGLRAVTMDIVTAYCYAHSFEGLSAPNFNHPILVAIESAMPIMTATKHFPILNVLHLLPDWATSLLNPDIVGVVQLRHFLSKQIDGILANPASLNHMNHETVYHHLVTPELLKSQQVPSKKSLMEEALAFLLAGTDTTSNAMVIGFFHVLNNPAIKKKLESELVAAWPDKDIPLSYEQLEKLPYLTGVIKESLRLSLGVTVPLPRVNDAASVVIDGVTVPPNSIVSSGVSFVLLNPNIFPDPHVFNPERWTHADSKLLDKYLVVFSKGPRSCIAINLAWAELYLMFGYSMRMLDMTLFETSAADVAFRYHTVPVWRGRPLQAVIKPQTS
ncbi:cytochrome P450 [Hymenopellis radicata]|nr:cytochrome P450 [Hymenopellis radicata]